MDSITRTADRAARSALMTALMTPSAWMEHQDPPRLGLICFRPHVTAALVALLEGVTAEDWTGESNIRHRTYLGRLPSGIHVHLMTDAEDAPEIPGLTITQGDDDRHADTDHA